MTTSFDLERHNDPNYTPPTPWHVWDTDAHCWCCWQCGAAASWQVHAANCTARPELPARRVLRWPPTAAVVVLGSTLGWALAQPERLVLVPGVLAGLCVGTVLGWLVHTRWRR